MEFENLLFVEAGFSANAGLPLANSFTSELLSVKRHNLDGPLTGLPR